MCACVRACVFLCVSFFSFFFIHLQVLAKVDRKETQKETEEKNINNFILLDYWPIQDGLEMSVAVFFPRQIIVPFVLTHR